MTDPRGTVEPGTVVLVTGARPAGAVPRAMQAADLAAAVSFLCSRGSGSVTGQTLVVDGGTVFA